MVPQCRHLNYQIRLTDEIEAYRLHALDLSLRETMVMTEQMETRFHRREKLVNCGLSGVTSLHSKRPRRLVCEQNVDPFDVLARIDFLTDEMATAIREFRRFGGALFGVRQ